MIAAEVGVPDSSRDWTADLTALRRTSDWASPDVREGIVPASGWTYESLDPDVDGALARLGLKAGRVLDVATGSGAQAIALARRGFDVTATCRSEPALDEARHRATDESTTVSFVTDPVPASRLAGPFDLIIDRDCFHHLDPADRAAYVEMARRLLAPSGHLLLTVLSFMHEGEDGPHRFTRSEIAALFEDRFEILGVADTVHPGPPIAKALFCVFRRQ